MSTVHPAQTSVDLQDPTIQTFFDLPVDLQTEVVAPACMAKPLITLSFSVEVTTSFAPSRLLPLYVLGAQLRDDTLFLGVSAIHGSGNT
jgi:hypothetical protein